MSSSHSLTTREWVLPPRPKPGRKPATDVPASKRQAQNRAAQQAYRVRRAAARDEIEQALRHERDAARAKERGDEARAKQREALLANEILAWQEKCRGLERVLETERGLTRDACRRLAELREEVAAAGDGPQPAPDMPPELVGCGNCTVLTRCECFETALGMATDPDPDQDPDPAVAVAGAAGAPQSSAGAATAASSSSSLASAKRRRSPDPADYHHHQTTSSSGGGGGGGGSSSHKRLHSTTNVADTAGHEADLAAAAAALETDFTRVFCSSAPPIRVADDGDSNGNANTNTNANANANAVPRSDLCGFCQDGTPCVCAQLEESVAGGADGDGGQVAAPPTPADITLSPTTENTLHHHHHHHHLSPPAPPPPPPPPPPPRRTPGSCAQCLVDPRRTVFCKSLAALEGQRSRRRRRRRRPRTNQNQPPPPPALAASPPFAPPPPPPPLTLSCADTYTALSRHAHYAHATAHLDSWLGQLQAKKTAAAAAAAEAEAAEASIRHHADPDDDDDQDQDHHHQDEDGGGQEEDETERRPALEIEAASVMGVLMLFDRRFGKT
ncbi:MAG: hypothetical protein M1826_002432 [Phylliscum demangeonii]|nr:MAG: hypothetical protein M1826_002432 [Phylliscum demangeonii]